MKIWIKNAKLLLPEGDLFSIRKGDLLIDDRIIRSIRTKDSGPDPKADHVIDASGRLVMPGLINAHTHAYMSLFRNHADDLPFFEWLRKVEEAEENLTEEDCYWGSLLSIAEMIRSGTTCFVDMNLRSAKDDAVSGPLGAVSAAVNDSKIRGFLSRGFVGTKDDKDSLRRFREFFAEMDLYPDHDRVKFLLGPHAPYSCQPDLLERIRELGFEKNMMATIHISESETEVRNMAKEKGGITPVRYVEESGLFDLPVIAAHCVNVTDEDIRILKNNNVSVALNPKSNMKLGNGFAPAEKMLKAGINLCLGTDGAASNNSQNMFLEMNAAALCYKGSMKKAKCMDAEDILRMATAGGARALGMEHMLGEIREGALADLIILDLFVPQFIPHNDIVSSLVYSANGSEVRTSIINGRIVMEENKILTFDEKEVYAKCDKAAKKLGVMAS